MRESLEKLRLESSSRSLEGNLGLPPLGGTWKRAFDVAIAGVALLVAIPLMLAGAALIRLSTDKSIILSERLIGRGGRTFVAYRFQIPAAESEASRWASQVAETLRSSCLDKLPQLFNVIRGEMSLVGPRPRAAAEFREYYAQARECLLARPGWIGIWQSHNAPSSDQQAEIAFERFYVSNWSVRLDLALMGKAIFSVHLGREARKQR